MEAQPAYTRSWKDIEMMLDEAREQMYEQKSKFHHRKRVGDKAGCRRAAAKFARAKGMVDMLIWVIGGKGVPFALKSLKFIFNLFELSFAAISNTAA